MIYTFRMSKCFLKEFKKIDKYTQKIISAWILKNLSNTTNPYIHGKSLTANRSGQWRYRIGVYRLLCEIEDTQLTILAITIGLRREVYD